MFKDSDSDSSPFVTDSDSDAKDSDLDSNPEDSDLVDSTTSLERYDELKGGEIGNRTWVFDWHHYL